MFLLVLCKNIIFIIIIFFFLVLFWNFLIILKYFGLFDFNGIIIRLLEFFIIDYLVGNLNVNFVENK